MTHRFRWFEEEAGYGLGRQIGHAVLTFALILALARVHLAFLGTIALLVLSPHWFIAASTAPSPGSRGIRPASWQTPPNAWSSISRDCRVLRALGRSVRMRTLSPSGRGLACLLSRYDRYGRAAGQRRAHPPRLALLSLIAVAVGLFAFGALGAPGLVVALVLVLLLQPPLEASIGEGFMLRLVGDAHGRAVAILEQTAP